MPDNKEQQIEVLKEVLKKSNWRLTGQSGYALATAILNSGIVDVKVPPTNLELWLDFWFAQVDCPNYQSLAKILDDAGVVALQVDEAP